MTWLGLDIGGANLKWADGRGRAGTRPFPLWQRPGELRQALEQVIADHSDAMAVAATMTGELADCYQTKAQGVRAIVDALVEAAGARDVWIYTTEGRFVPPLAAKQDPLRAAASNWHALARLAARFAPAMPALLIDIGSTTTDIIPLRGGQPGVVGYTDPERLQSGELVYTGVVRSPLCAIVRRLPWRGGWCTVAQEVFATARDVYLVLGELPEDSQQRDTADGRPATREYAADRLARMVCADRTLATWGDIQAIARHARRAQLRMIGRAARGVLNRQPSPIQSWVLSGQGEFLARRLAPRLAPALPVSSLTVCLGRDVSLSAAAHAVALLAGERVQ